MGFWKVILSRIAGRRPSVNQMDHETIAKNARTGALYVIKESEAGVKEVVEIAGGAPGTGESHLRAHQIDSADDHPPVAEAKRGKIVATNDATGAVELIGKDQVGAILDIYAADDPYFPIEHLMVQKPGVSPDTRVTTMLKPRGLLWGGMVSWLDGMWFGVSGAIYYIAGTMLFAPDIKLELDEADPSNPRIDVIVATGDGEFVVITGTPGANPVKPYVDPVAQIEIAEITVPAGATGFGGSIFREVVYNENIEWTGTGTGVTVDFDSLTDPFFGSKCASVDSIGNNDYIKFVNDAPVAVADFDNLYFALKLKAAASKTDYITVTFYLAGVAISAAAIVQINRTSMAWQQLYLVMQEIKFKGTQFDEVRFVWRSTGGLDHSGFYLDYIRLEKGISAPPVNTSIILEGDVTGNGVTGTPVQTTLKTVNANVGQFGSAAKVPKVTVDGKGRITAVEEVDITGVGGDSAYVYIAYASDASGTGFTLTFNAALDYIAILATDTEIPSPAAGDFAGLWKKYKGEDGTDGAPGADGADGADGVGVPAGGTLGQVLTKSSEDDYDTSWQTPSGGGGSTELTAIPATDKTASGITTQLTANEAQAFGDVVKINSSGKAQIAKADVIANATALAMCVSESVEADATGNYLLIGFVRNDAWDWTVGGDIFLTIAGTSGNTLSQTSPFAADPIVEDTVVQLLGVANSADTIYFNPQLVQVELKP